MKAISECTWCNDNFIWRAILSWISNLYLICATTVDTWFNNRPDIIYLKHAFSIILTSREPENTELSNLNCL